MYLPPVSTTLTGQVERVTFENEESGFRVLRVGALDDPKQPGPIVVVGNFQAVGPGTRVRVTGDFVRDPRRGEQFRETRAGFHAWSFGRVRHTPHARFKVLLFTLIRLGVLHHAHLQRLVFQRVGRIGNLEC